MIFNALLSKKNIKMLFLFYFDFIIFSKNYKTRVKTKGKTSSLNFTKGIINHIQFDVYLGKVLLI